MEGARYLCSVLKASPEKHLGFITALYPEGEGKFIFSYGDHFHRFDVNDMEVLRQGSRTKVAVFVCHTDKNLKFVLKAG